MSDDAESDPKSDQRAPVDGSARESEGEADEAPRDHIIDPNAVTTDIGERLKQLEVDALKESLAYWLRERDKYLSGEGTKRNTYSAWWCSKLASGVQRELDARRGRNPSALLSRLRRRSGRRVGRVDRNDDS